MTSPFQQLPSPDVHYTLSQAIKQMTEETARVVMAHIADSMGLSGHLIVIPHTNEELRRLCKCGHSLAWHHDIRNFECFIHRCKCKRFEPMDEATEECTARALFKEGQRIRMTKEALSCGLGRNSSTGVVVGFGRQSYLVRVQRDGIKTRQTYHIKFWEPEA